MANSYGQFTFWVSVFNILKSEPSCCTSYKLRTPPTWKMPSCSNPVINDLMFPEFLIDGPYPDKLDMFNPWSDASVAQNGDIR